MKRRLCFTSSKFWPVPGEEERTNPGVFGETLARWVRDELIARGRDITKEPIPEDWGWVVMVSRKPITLWVGCANDEGSSDKWSVFVEAEQSAIQKLFKRIDTKSPVMELEHQLELLIKAEKECSSVHWSLA